jgi:transcriptional regulator with XRE-family HTH domain
MSEKVLPIRSDQRSHSGRGHRTQDKTLTEIGGRLREWRRYRRRSQIEVAEAVGITQASLSNYERGKRDAPISTLLAIADTLNVQIADLVEAAPPSVEEEDVRFQSVWRLVTEHPEVLDSLAQLSRSGAGHHFGLPARPGSERLHDR